MEIKREDGDIVHVEIDTGNISFDEGGDMGYNGKFIVGGYRLTSGGIGGLMNGWYEVTLNMKATDHNSTWIYIMGQ